MAAAVGTAAGAASALPPLATGGVAVITGASNGIGLVFTRNLLAARTYSHVIVAARSEKRCQEALDALSPSLPPPAEYPTRLEALPCDMSSLASVTAFCAAVKAKVSAIQLLVGNAGIIAGSAFDSTSTKSPDGFELSFATNHLSHFHMVSQLLPLLQAAGHARVVLTSSEMHKASRPPRGAADVASWREVATEVGRTTCATAYGDSKLANLLHAMELNRRFGKPGANGSAGIVTANSLHPGGIRETGIWAPQRGLAKFLIDGVGVPLGRLFGMWQTVDEGASAIAACASAPEGGLFREVHKWVPPAPLARDPHVAAACWEASEQLVREALARIQVSE